MALLRIVYAGFRSGNIFPLHFLFLTVYIENPISYSEVAPASCEHAISQLTLFLHYVFTAFLQFHSADGRISFDSKSCKHGSVTLI